MTTFSDIRSDNNSTKLELPNEIWMKIFSSLTHGDLLQINLVCKDWYDLIVALNIKHKSKLVITGQNLKNIYDLMQRGTLRYKCIEIDERSNEISSVDHVLLCEIFEQIGSDIVQLKLYNLSTLSVLNNLLPNLKELDLLCVGPKKGVSIDFNKFPNLKSLKMPHFAGNYTRSHLLESLTQISRTRLEKLLLIDNYSLKDTLKALASHASSLRWLQLHFNSWCFSRITLPLLSQLSETFKTFSHLELLDMRAIETKELKKIILENLSTENPLQTIVLRSDCMDDDVHDDLLELIAQKWSGSLECLKFLCWDTTGNSVNQLSLMSGKLKSLSMYGCRLAAHDIIHSIAPKTNNKLRELNLFHSRLIGQSFCTLVQRLPNLIALNLTGCNSKVGDEEMVYIFRHLPQMRHLFLPPCISQNGIEYLCSNSNISNLKRLQTLSSCLCPINVVQILNLNVKFKELRYFKLYSCQRNPVSKARLTDIAAYIPALEKLFAVYLLFDNNDIQEIRKSFPRLRELNRRRLF
uniref:F-box domain-containing protein n=1 Tax=Glossina brevipalpis TaxID=37001 RepID=A0A1A9WHB8_9MUSC